MRLLGREHAIPVRVSARQGLVSVSVAAALVGVLVGPGAGARRADAERAGPAADAPRPAPGGCIGPAAVASGSRA